MISLKPQELKEQLHSLLKQSDSGPVLIRLEARGKPTRIVRIELEKTEKPAKPTVPPPINRPAGISDEAWTELQKPVRPTEPPLPAPNTEIPVSKPSLSDLRRMQENILSGQKSPEPVESPPATMTQVRIRLMPKSLAAAYIRTMWSLDIYSEADQPEINDRIATLPLK